MKAAQFAYLGGQEVIFLLLQSVTALETGGITPPTCKRGSGTNLQSQSNTVVVAATATTKTEVPKSETLELAVAMRELAAAIRQSRNGER